MNRPGTSYSASIRQEFDSSLVVDLLKLASRDDVISFAIGLASPDSGPLETLKGIEHELVANKNYRALMHTPTEGFMTLRQSVCTLMRSRGVFCRPEEIMMLAGSQEGIDLTARVFVDPGDIVVVEEPTYFPAIQSFRTAGARVLGVPTDENGMRTEILEQLLDRYRPKLIYTMPNLSESHRSLYDLERRKRLVELAAKHSKIVLEDDAYGDLSYEGSPPPMLRALDARAM
jgi:DNA-binding transcriptional MocR family regulator